MPFVALFALLLSFSQAATRANEAQTTQPRNRSLLEPAVHSTLTPSTTESLAEVRLKLAEKLAKVDAIWCEVEMSKKRDKKPTRKVYAGPMTIARHRGGYVRLERKGEVEEYYANAKELCAYDHKKKQAYVIPATTPIIGFFVAEALKLNAFLTMDPESLRFLGYQSSNGELCWVFEGNSPARLHFVGVPVRKMRVWVSVNDGLPREIRIPKEKDLAIVLRNIVINPPVNDNQFQWTAPPEVNVKRILGR